MPLFIGQILNNRYQIDALLGQGGMGAVYRATDSRLNIVVAIKENLDASPSAQSQFSHEAQIAARLSHPNLPRVSDYFFIPGQGQYLVMDYIEGEDLESMSNRLGLLPERYVLRWILQVCDALEYLHQQNPPVIHRDIKPANIKIRPNGQAVLVDFGIAKVYDPTMSTTLGAKAVTPGYSPIEQYGGRPTDARSDIYSLGATLYRLLTGQTLPESVQLASAESSFTLPRQLNPQINPTTEQAILKAIELATSRRFQSAAELRSALIGQRTHLVEQHTPEQAIPTTISFTVAGPTVVAPSSAPLAQPVKKSSSRKWVYWMVGIGVGFVGLSIVAVLVFISTFGSSLGLLAQKPAQLTAVFETDQAYYDATDTAIVQYAQETETALQATDLALTGRSTQQALIARVTQQAVDLQETLQAKDTQISVQATLSVLSAQDTQQALAAEATRQARDAQATQIALQSTRQAPGYIPSIQGWVASLSFFEDGKDLSPLGQRNYTSVIDGSTARYIAWELTFDREQSGQRVDFSIDSIYYRPDGSELDRFTSTSYFEADWTSMITTEGWGWDNPGNWTPGVYHVEFYILDQKIYEGSFTVK